MPLTTGFVSLNIRALGVQRLLEDVESVHSAHSENPTWALVWEPSEKKNIWTTGGTAVLILVFGSVSVLRKQDLDAADLAFAFEAANTSNEMDWILPHIWFFFIDKGKKLWLLLQMCTNFRPWVIDLKLAHYTIRLY